jgi:hypothetical protein
MCVTPNNAPVHELQCCVLHESNQLFNKPRKGIVKMEVDVCLPLISLPCRFAKQDSCSAIYNNWLLEALIYFLPTYILDKKSRNELYADLRRAALVGGDCITM